MARGAALRHPPPAVPRQLAAAALSICRCSPAPSCSPRACHLPKQQPWHCRSLTPPCPAPRQVLAPEFSKPYMASLQAFMEKEWASASVYPQQEAIFRALNSVPFDQVRGGLRGAWLGAGLGQEPPGSTRLKLALLPLKHAAVNPNPRPPPPNTHLPTLAHRCAWSCWARTLTSTRARRWASLSVCRPASRCHQACATSTSERRQPPRALPSLRAAALHCCSRCVRLGRDPACTCFQLLAGTDEGPCPFHAPPCCTQGAVE